MCEFGIPFMQLNSDPWILWVDSKSIQIRSAGCSTKTIFSCTWFRYLMYVVILLAYILPYSYVIITYFAYLVLNCLYVNLMALFGNDLHHMVPTYPCRCPHPEACTPTRWRKAWSWCSGRRRWWPSPKWRPGGVCCGRKNDQTMPVLLG